MNMILLFVTLFAVGMLLAESHQVRGWFDGIYNSFHKPQDQGLDFLLGIDRIMVTDEEVSEFKKFLLSKKEELPVELN